MKTNVKLMMALMATAALTACGGGSDGGSSNGDPSDVPLTQAPALVQQYAGMFNALRSAPLTCGTEAQPARAPLSKWSPKLQQAAEKHADDMVKNGFFSHTGSDGSSAIDRAAAYGYQGQVVGENLARGPGSPSTTVDAWRNSTGHCLTIMGEFPASVAVAQRGAYKVAMFGN